jgi:ubiquinone/menaquinone biosynthesis C-methylase UbiE
MSHSTDLQLVIREVRRVLKQGGRFGLMFCGQRYYYREHYIASNLITGYSARELAHSFREDADLRFVGINYCNDAVVSFLSVGVLTFLFRAQLRRRDVDNAYFITVFGEKRSG